MERWIVKLLALIIIFIVTETMTLLPIKVSGVFVRMGATGMRIISYLMCFGGGVFLGLYMLHMSPDVKEILDESLINRYNISYPLAEFIIAMGFFLMLFSEKLVIKLQKRGRRRKSDDSITVAANPETSHRENNVTKPMLHDETGFNAELKPGGESNGIQSKTDHNQATIDFGHGHSHGVSELAGTRSLLLLLALSLHHVFEGISVGLKHTNRAVWTLTIAILSHEVVIAFCLGMQLVSTYKSKKKVVIAGTLCSAMVPVGIAIGMLIMETGGGDESQNLNLLNGILQALSTGVFVYVTFFEILGGEVNPNDSSITKIVFILLGFLVLAALGLVPEGEDVESIVALPNVTATAAITMP